jgi:hypothetical protein
MLGVHNAGNCWAKIRFFGRLAWACNEVNKPESPNSSGVRCGCPAVAGRSPRFYEFLDGILPYVVLANAGADDAAVFQDVAVDNEKA